MFEKRVLSRIIVYKREQVVREWKKLHNKGLHNLVFSTDKRTY
jgi:hypothetical protein